MYNLEFMLDSETFIKDEEEISRKNTKVRATYNVFLSSKKNLINIGERALELNLIKTEKSVINLIIINQFITQTEIAQILNLSENCIYRNIKSLKNKNLIKRSGSNKNGHWQVIDNFSNKCKDKFMNKNKSNNLKIV